jgi:hypothetical protein
MRGRLSTDLPFTCVTCEIEIAGHPTFHVGLPFCCAGCVAGGPCSCSYDRSPNASRIRERLDVETSVGREASSQVAESVAGLRH